MRLAAMCFICSSKVLLPTVVSGTVPKQSLAKPQYNPVKNLFFSFSFLSPPGATASKAADRNWARSAMSHEASPRARPVKLDGDRSLEDPDFQTF